MSSLSSSPSSSLSLSQQKQQQRQQRQIHHAQQQQQQQNQHERLIYMFLTYNFDGVTLLQYGNHMDALGQFRKALDLLRNDIMLMSTTTYDNNNNDLLNDSISSTLSSLGLIQHQRQQRCPPNQQPCHQNPQHNIVLPLLMSVPLNVIENDDMMLMPISSTTTSTSSSIVDVMSMSPHNVFILYERAFVFDPIMMRQYFMTSSSSSNLCQLLCTSALLFNMGMTCHRHGLSSAGSNQSTYFLKKALGLYQMIISLMIDESSTIVVQDDANTKPIDCLSIGSNNNINIPNEVHNNQDDESSTQRHEENALFFLLKLAVWSNIGHIYSHFFMNNEVDECRIELTQLLQNPPLINHKDDKDDQHYSRMLLLSDEEYSFFVLNTVTNHSFHKVAPAA